MESQGNLSFSSLPILSNKNNKPNYQHWSVKMKTLFISQDVWELVEEGFEDLAEGATAAQRNAFKDKVKRDAKALYMLQQAVDETIFPRIMNATRSKEAWNILQQEFLGTAKVITVKLQTLRREFETASMKPNEAISDFIGRHTSLVNQMRSLGEDLSEQKVVEKVLRSLNPKFNHVAAAIEESKDLSTLTMSELLGSLTAHEQRLNRGKEDEGTNQAFVSRITNRSSSTFGRGFANSNSGRNGRGRGYSRGGRTQRSFSNQPRTENNYRHQSVARGCSYCGRDNHRVEFCWYKNNSGPKCSKCLKIGHMEKDCRQGKLGQQANFAEDEITEEENLFMSQVMETSPKTMLTWYIDSGCSNHMTGNKDLFISLSSIEERDVKLGNNETVNVSGVGDIEIMLDDDKRVIQNVMYVPSLKHNLLSVGQMLKHNFRVIFDEEECRVYDKRKRKLVCVCKMAKNKMFPIMLTSVECMFSSMDESNVTLWHKRYCHYNTNGLVEMSKKEMVQGMPGLHHEKQMCEACTLGKQHKKHVPSQSSWRASKPLELLHTDLCGPMNTTSLGGARYFMIIVDDFSRYSWIYFLADKSQTFDTFKKFKMQAENEVPFKIKGLRSDRGGEFISGVFMKFCAENGIKRQLTSSYTPQQNGVAERKNRVVMELARSALKDKSLPVNFWAEACATVVHVLNRCITSALRNKTPYEAYKGVKPKVNYLRVFGSLVYVLKPEVMRRKLDDRSKKGIFIGYSQESKGYRIYDPETKKVITSKDVEFNEDKAWNWKEKESEVAENIPIQFEVEEPADTEPEPEQSSSFSSSSSSSNSSSSSSNSNSNGPPNVRTRTLADIYNEAYEFFACFVAEPADYIEAKQDPKWNQAMQEELNAIERNKTWSLCELPSKKKAVDVKWLYKTKYNANGSVNKLKARLVARGFTQIQGEDYEETYAPVARYDTIRSVLAIAASHGWKVKQLDVKSAFLNGELQEEIYVKQPPGFEVPKHEAKVYKLHKALYGLKQAPRTWYIRIHTFLMEKGYHRSESEATLYVRKEEANILMLCVYVDDIIYTSNNEDWLDEFRSEMMKEFEMSDLGKLHYFLGLEVHQLDDGIFINQQKYAKQMLKKLKMQDCNAISTPFNPKEKLIIDENEPKVDEKYFRSIVGGLMYLSHTRPDLCYAINQVARVMHKPNETHLLAAKRILKYVAGTIDYGLMFEKVNSSKLLAYSDSDFGSSTHDRKSLTGYALIIGNSCVSWGTKKQDTVALSTAEAE